MNIGRDEATTVSSDYAAPFAFQGKLHLLSIEVPPTKPTKADQRAQAAAELAEQ